MRKKIGIVFAILISVFIVYNLIGQIFSALKAGDRLTQAVSKLEEMEVKNKELKNRLQEVASSDFVEKQARDKLGLAREGETVIVIPEDKLKQVLGTAEKSLEEQRLPNPLGWLRLFFD